MLLIMLIFTIYIEITSLPLVTIVMFGPYFIRVHHQMVMPGEDADFTVEMVKDVALEVS